MRKVRREKSEKMTREAGITYFMPCLATHIVPATSFGSTKFLTNLNPTLY